MTIVSGAGGLLSVPVIGRVNGLALGGCFETVGAVSLTRSLANYDISLHNPGSPEWNGEAIR